MAEAEFQLPHKLTLSERQTLTVTGVSEVVSFDDTAVQLNTVQGCLFVHGKQLRLKNLSPEGGQLTISGKVTALIYEELRQKGGLFGRLFG